MPSSQVGKPLHRWGQLILGLAAWAVAVALMIRSGLGLGPWDAFHVGFAGLADVSIGTASVLTSVVVLAIGFAVGMKPGLGTLANILAIGLLVDATLPLVPEAPHWGVGLGYYAAAIALIGAGTGLYIGARLGAGPRDGLMVALSRRSGWPVGRVRAGIELTVLLLGWLMGARLGVGTVLFAVGIGPSVQWGMSRWAPAETPQVTRSLKKAA